MRLSCILMVLLGLFTHRSMAQYPTQFYTTLMTGGVIGADLFDKEPKIFTANYAFEGIKGVANGTEKDAAIAAGGAWMDLPAECANTTIGALLSTVSDPVGVANSGWGYPMYNNVDAMPVVFSWPVLPSTVNNTDFKMTLNTGETVTPDGAGITPNFETNERQTVVVFGQFGNREDPDIEGSGAIYVTEVEIVDDGTPLMLVGPGNKLFNAVGLKYSVGRNFPYGEKAVGPKLVAAKLNYMKDVTAGEGPNTLNQVAFPNDCVTLYGDGVKYRLRMYTSGGFSPDGVSSMTPDSFEKYFRVLLDGPDGKTISLTETGKQYNIGADSLYIYGLADLGAKNATYNYLCYLSDQDNYIDICMNGTDAAVKRITAVEMPYGNSTADPKKQYQPLYNPGGPGNNPTPGVNYSKPNSYQVQSVMFALDDPMVVTYQEAAAPGAAPKPATPTPSGGGAVVPPQTPAPSPSTPSSAVVAKLGGVALLIVGFAMV